jgi:hypothetical protein
MKKIAIVAASILMLGACSSNQSAKLMMTDPVKYNTIKVEKQVDLIPTWYLSHPKSEDNIYSSGTAVTPDMQLAMDIAVLNAKTTLADRINGRLSSKTKNFISRIGSNDLDAAVAMDIQRVTTNLIADVDVAGYAVEKSKVVQDGPQYRAYVLLAYSDREANKILINRLRKERMLLDKLQATNAYKDLEESVALKKEQDLNEMEIIVKGLSQ